MDLGGGTREVTGKCDSGRRRAERKGVVKKLEELKKPVNSKNVKCIRESYEIFNTTVIEPGTPLVGGILSLFVGFVASQLLHFVFLLANGSRIVCQVVRSDIIGRFSLKSHTGLFVCFRNRIFYLFPC